MLGKAFTLAALAALVMPAFCAEWLTDFEAAKQKAAAEHKPIILDFTGSDWCGACMHLHSTIFEKPEFDAFVKDRFVLLEIDCPHGDKMPKEEKARNEALVAHFSVHAFPTVLVLSPAGDVTGGFLGSGFSMEQIQKELQEGLDNFAKLEKAQALTGDEKLKALSDFYKSSTMMPAPAPPRWKSRLSRRTRRIPSVSATAAPWNSSAAISRSARSLSCSAVIRSR